MAREIIITCAVTGSVHTPSMSPYLPLTPQQIGNKALAAAEAGAAILHLHARSPVDGFVLCCPSSTGPFIRIAPTWTGNDPMLAANSSLF